MNHNTARCSSCNTICVLPHLRARASAAKCEACARREAEKVRGSRAFETEPRDPFLNNMVGPPRGSFNNILKRVYADDFRITVPRDAVIYDDKLEQRATWHPEAGSIPCKCGGWITPRFQHGSPGCGPKGVLAADGIGGLVDPYLVNSSGIFAAYSSNLSLHEQAKLAR